MIKPTITIVNQATTPLNVELKHTVAALQLYLHQFMLPIWGEFAILKIADQIQPDAWTIALIDNADMPGALGYHSLGPNGLPYGRVFVQTALQNGELPTVTLAHELVEMLVDPYCQMLMMNMDSGDIYPYEIADAVEEEHFIIAGVPVTNFVYPSWYESFHTAASVRFDVLGTVKRPFELRSGGYASVVRNSSFVDIFGSKQKEERFRREDRRGHRVEIWKSHVHRLVARSQ